MKPEEFIADYKTALTRQNWDRVEPLIHTNACVTFSTGSVHKGIEAIKTSYERNFALIKNEEYVMADVHWLVNNQSIAVYTFNYSWKGIINGQQASGKGRGTAVIVFENGSWKLIAEQLTAAT
jgi:hypothetical protein